MNCSGSYAYGNRMFPVSLDQKAIQKLKVEDGVSFWGAPKKFIENKSKTGTQSYASGVYHLQGMDVATQTTSLLNQGNASLASQTIHSKVSTYTGDLLTPTVPGV
jgi:hypothetical protein